jgi:photoactive yellow protein
MVSHGVCLPCTHRFELLPSEEILDLAQSDVNLLPFGAIVLDRQGTILKYNSAESAISGYDAATVIGQNFFEVAPCTNVQEFAGRVAKLQANRTDARETFEFVFMFKNGGMMVQIVCLHEGSSQQTTLLVAASL